MTSVKLDDVCDPLTARKYAKEASVTLSDARQVLEEYLKKNVNGQLWALYEISGIVNPSEVPFIANFPSDVTKNVVVPEKELESAKLKFKSIISTQIYSIQRTNPKETRVYGRQWDNDDDLVGIKLPTLAAPPKKMVKQEDTKEKTPEPVVKVEKKKNIGLMSMFTTKPKEETKKRSPEKIVVPEKEKTPSPIIKRKRPKVEIDEDDLFDKADDQPDIEPMEEETEKEEQKQVKPPAKRKRALNEENQDKSRKSSVKRPLIIDDSEEEKTIKKEEGENTPKKIQLQKPSGERRRTTKIEKVVETFVDEDGFLVSKEVNKTIECSPEKSPEKPKPKISAPPPGQAKPAKKNASIMSFFKKA